MHGTSFTLKMGVTIIGWPVSSFVLLPLFKQLEGVSIFKFIGNRFNVYMQRFVSLLFIGQMLFITSIALYLPSLPLLHSLGIPQKFSIGLVGLICSIYGSFGGLKAVTWCNVYHTLLLLISTLAILVLGTWHCGGIQRVLSESYQGERLSVGPDYWRLDLSTRHTLYNTLLSYPIIRLFLHGTNQMQVQSALSLSSMRKSQMSQLLAALINFLIQVVASAIGLVLYVTYRDCDPFISGTIRRQDELLVHYVSSKLSQTFQIPAIQGLFLASICGATLTAMSSFQSSISAMIVEDFIKPVWIYFELSDNSSKLTASSNQKEDPSLIDSRSSTLLSSNLSFDQGKGKQWQWRCLPPLNEQLAASLSKFVALLLGLMCIMITHEMDKLHGFSQATTTLYGVIGAPILATFLCGALFSRRYISSGGMFIGLMCSISFGLWVFLNQISHSQPLEPALGVSIQGCPRSLGVLANSTEMSLPWLKKHNIIYKEKQQQQDHLTLLLTDGELDDKVQIIDLWDMSEVGKNNKTHQVNQIRGWSMKKSLDQLTRMSYLWLPMFTFSISVFVALLMSLILSIQVTAAAAAAETPGSDDDVRQEKLSGQFESNCSTCLRLALNSKLGTDSNKVKDVVLTGSTKTVDILQQSESHEQERNLWLVYGQKVDNLKSEKNSISNNENYKRFDYCWPDNILYGNRTTTTTAAKNMSSKKRTKKSSLDLLFTMNANNIM